jgi:YD repeat-containing protein
VTSRGGAGTTSYVYDSLGRQVEQWTGSAGTGSKTAAWTYDPTSRPGLLGQMTLYDAGNAYTTGYTYDSLGRVTKTQVTIPAAEASLAGTGCHGA